MLCCVCSVPAKVSPDSTATINIFTDANRSDPQSYPVLEYKVRDDFQSLGDLHMWVFAKCHEEHGMVYDEDVIARTSLIIHNKPGADEKFKHTLTTKNSKDWWSLTGFLGFYGQFDISMPMNLKRIGGGHGLKKGVNKTSTASKMNLLRGQLLTYERPENGVHASIDDLIQNITTTPNYITTVLVSMEPNEVKKVHDQLSKMKSFHTDRVVNNIVGYFVPKVQELMAEQEKTKASIDLLTQAFEIAYTSEFDIGNVYQPSMLYEAIESKIADINKKEFRVQIENEMKAKYGKQDDDANMRD